jgi:hypothetical protein
MARLVPRDESIMGVNNCLGRYDGLSCILAIVTWLVIERTIDQRKRKEATFSTAVINVGGATAASNGEGKRWNVQRINQEAN